MGIAGLPLKEPILDIGCGKDANLVRLLRMNGFQAYGMDRSVETTEYTTKANWFEFSLRPNDWGTVFSHMAFSNHFGHHLLRKDGDYRAYMLKFIEILQSLKVGGTFIFSPPIPFLEEAMENDSNYRVVRYEEQTAAVTRLRG